MKRYAIAALAAFLLLVTITAGAAPDTERQIKLRRMQDLIRKLREAEARQEAIDDYLGDDGKRVIEVHRVGGLTARRNNFIGPNLIIMPAGAEVDEDAPVFGKSEEGERIFMQTEDIMDLITSQVRPGAFGAGGAQIMVTETGDLLVIADLSLQEEIRRFLGELRQGVGKLVTVQARVLRFHPEAALPVPGGLLSREEALRLLEQAESGQGVEVIHSSRLTGFSGQRVHVWQGVQRAFVQDYDVQVAEDSTIADPIVGVLQTGFRFEVRPTIAGRGNVAMDLRVQVTALTEMPRNIPMEGGLAAAPDQGVVVFASAVTVADGGFALLQGRSGNDPHRWALLLSPIIERNDHAVRNAMTVAELDRRIAELVRAVEEIEGGPAEGTSPEVVFRIHDVGGLTRAVQQWCGEDINLVPSGGFGFGFADQEDLDPIRAFSAEVLADLIRMRILPDSWGNLEGTMLRGRGEQLFVRHTPKTQGRIARLLDHLLSSTTAQVELGVDFVRMSDATLRRILGPGDRSILGPEAEARLTEALRTGQAALIREGSMICADRQRVGLSELNQVTYLQDYDVEIAQASDIPDPIVQTLRDGRVIDLTPVIGGDDGSVFLEVRISASRLHRPIEWAETDVGNIQVPELGNFKLRTSVRIPAGRAMVVGGTVTGRDEESMVVIVRPKMLR